MSPARVAPELGMPATIWHYAVREAATITAVADGGQRVTARPDDGGAPIEFSLRATGKFICVGEQANGGTRLIVGRVTQ